MVRMRLICDKYRRIEKWKLFLYQKGNGSIVKVCRDGNVLCKVIFENCYLTREEIKKTAEIAKEAGPDFIKPALASEHRVQMHRMYA